MASAPAPPALSPSTSRLDGLSDEALAERLAGDGDELAFEALYGRYAPGLLSLCRHLLGSREEAEDAVQQVFMQAYRQIARGHAPDRLRPWLYVAARNRCISMQRARGERTVALAEPSTEGLDRQVERMADVRALLRDLHKLPEDQRTALVLFELGDLSQADIAQVLECDTGRVKSLVFRARSNLLAARDARDASCSSIRRELAVARGGELNSGALRRHLEGCESCTLYLENVRRQRRALGVLVPVVPAAGLYGRLAGSSGAGGAATDGGSRLPFGTGRGRAAVAGATAAAALVLAAVLGLSATGEGEPDAATPPPASTPAAAERASAAQRAGDGEPPAAVRSSPPPAQSPSLDAYETEGLAAQRAIGEGGGPGGGATGGAGAAAGTGQGGAGSGSALPFTGVDVVAIVAAGLLLLGLGWALRRIGTETPAV